MSGRGRLTRGPRPTSFKRTVWAINWTPSTATTNSFWRYTGVTPINIPNWSEYQALFDQYRINGVKATFRPRYDSFAGNDTTDVTLPNITNQAGCLMHVINDPTSSVTPTGVYGSTVLQSFMEQGNVKTYSGNKAFSIYFKPTIEDNIVSGTQRRKAPWLQTKDNSIPHWGFHVFAQDVNLTGNFGQSFDIYYTFYFQCRGST